MLKMSVAMYCRCCLLRPPDKNLLIEYTLLGKTEVYADMLKECFMIPLVMVDDESSGICGVCVSRLRDAFDFKLQVQQCQKELLAKKLEPPDLPQVKEEIIEEDEDNGIMFLELNDGLSDYEDANNDNDLSNVNGNDDDTYHDDDEDDKKLAEILIQSVAVSSKGKKRELILEASESKKRSNKVFNALKNCFSDPKKHQNNMKNILRYSNCTPFSNKTIAGISCAYCKAICPNIDGLRTHTQQKHNGEEIPYSKRHDKNNISMKMDITDLKCNICNAKCDVIVSLKKHLAKEHNITFYPDVKDYIMEFKLTTNEIMTCALCNSTYETFKTLLQHMNGHYRNYICDVCDMGFINKHRLKNHTRTHDLGTFKCMYCEKIFSTRVRMVCHEKYTHNSAARSRYTTNCPHCEKSFNSYYQRNRHMSLEHNASAATYKCNVCDKSFILKSKLTSHIKKVHLMERNHICTECGQGFFIKQSLDEHMVKHNGKRVFQCAVCNKAYARKKTLKEHMRIHNNDRRFKCGMCGSAFIQKCSLKSHMLSHHGLTLCQYENTKKIKDSP